jgi:hypothetical protein
MKLRSASEFKRWAFPIMSLTIKFLAAITLLFLATHPASAQDAAQPSTSTEQQIRQAITSQLPAPPEGFVWQLYKNAVFLKPVKWNERERGDNITGIPYTTYSASPEEFSDTKQFEMGVTVQLIINPQHIRGIEAKKMAFVYLKPFLDTHKKEEVLMLEQSTKGDFDRTFFRYRDAPLGLKPIIVHKFILANNVTDSVHIFTFESPSESWDENWSKYGMPIIGKLNVLPNVPPQ